MLTHLRPFFVILIVSLGVFQRLGSGYIKSHTVTVVKVPLSVLLGVQRLKHPGIFHQSSFGQLAHRQSRQPPKS